ncbi:uncharacterized protein LOC142181871 [Nicotiana tabacum]|uniref:Uncharacterized protein LOC142181871 n=1 Tax=Nicotiana tabacum TaxID=4097 RepID=A0AC58UQ32_TOBAC
MRNVTPFIILRQKLKIVKKALTSWSTETFGDNFKQIASLEDVIKVHEVEFELNPTYQNRAKHLRVKKRGKPSNVVIKLYMAKAYDRLSWLFLTKVLRQIGFDEKIIDMLYMLVSNNCYLVLLNGHATGFFKSKGGEAR